MLPSLKSSYNGIQVAAALEQAQRLLHQRPHPNIQAVDAADGCRQQRLPVRVKEQYDALVDRDPYDGRQDFQK